MRASSSCTLTFNKNSVTKLTKKIFELETKADKLSQDNVKRILTVWIATTYDKNN